MQSRPFCFAACQQTMPQSKAHFLTSANDPANWPDHDYKEIVVVGRSNVGKSSFINALLNQKSLAYVGSTPGKTQLLNFFLVDDRFCLVDVPGYGYAKLSKKQLESIGKMMEDYFSKRDNIDFVIVLIDARQGPTADDIDMIEYLQSKNRSILPIVTKIDKIPSTKQKPVLKKIAEQLGIEPEDLMAVSSLKKKGFDEVFERIEELIA